LRKTISVRDKSSQYFPLVEKYHSSGLTKKIFCDSHGIKPCTLDYWKKRYRDRNKPVQEEKKGFASLRVEEGKCDMTISIQYTDGTRLFFESSLDVNTIRQFIPAFNK